jgi:hypothetical protein
MPLQATSGAASYDGFGGGPAAVPNYIEECFATHLYTGNGSTQTITNGIDLSTKGGLVWLKSRSAATSHCLIDTVRGSDQTLFSNSSGAQSSNSNRVSAFNSTGFSLGSDSSTNTNAATYASWVFRKQAKFFDCVTYTGDGNSTQTINHSLGTTVGCAIIKCTSNGTTNWIVYHRSLLSDDVLKLNSTAAKTSNASFSSTSTSFTVRNYNVVSDNTNESGRSYVAYLFAHDAGGFGLTGTDNVISCGSYTGTGAAGNAITLGYEPQWLLIKRTDSTSDWAMFNNMMGMTLTDDTYLWANLASVENTYNVLAPTATGFVFQDPYLNASGGTYIYIAIRRGPMKTPTTGTSVFSPNAVTGNALVTTNFPVDSAWIDDRGGGSTLVTDRLRGSSQTYYNNLSTTSTAAENTGTGAGLGFDNNTGYQMNAWGGTSQANINWNFRRAPGFFDVVCYTGTGSATTQAHNLGVVPELMIVKRRNAGSEFDWWPVYSKAPFNDPAVYQLNTTSGAFGLTSVWNSTNPTASVFSVGTSQTTNASGGTYVAYLFASCPGVSKCGSYTGTGALQTIDCGFTGGARFVLIKRYDNSGDWFVYDSARGITSGNDPYLFLNSTAAEVTGTNYVDTTSVGFQVTAAAPAGLNANGGTYIFLAVA